jgi:subfamily B ATP-binding cassette protein MsbA
MDQSPPAAKARSKISASAWRDARALLAANRGRLLLGLVLLLVGRLAALVLPASSKFLVDEVVTKGRGEALGQVALAIVAAALVQAGTSLWLARAVGVAAQREIMKVRRSLHRHVVRLPIRYFDSTRSGALISRIMSDPDGLRNLLGNGLIQLGSSLLTALLAFFVLLYLNWRLTAATLILLGGFGGLMALAFSRLRPLFRERGELNARLTGALSESLNGIRVIKAYRAEKREELAFARRIHALFRNVAREVTLSSMVGTAGILIFSGIAALLFYLGGRSILAGAMSLGDFVMFVFFIGLLIAPVVRLADSATQLSEAFGGLDRLRELRAEPTEADDAGARSLGSVEGDLELREVSFGYAAENPVLQGISLHARPGSTTALVGPSGAGKSTLIGLIMAFHRPQQGAVLVDGIDLATVRLRDYRAHLGVVLQDNFLFEGTIAENIAYSRPRASRTEVERAARLAHCDEIAARLPEGYDTLVGERGVKLSGGERQRVAIARALLADPRILILDEATSSLDSESEALIQDGLNELRRGRTTFVIAHRLSTVRSADLILVLEAGRIVERGSHEELLARGGRYRQLYDRQYRFDNDQLLDTHRSGSGESEGTEASGDPAAGSPLEVLIGRVKAPKL